MHKKHLIVLAAVVTAGIAGTALAKGPLTGQRLTPVVPVTLPCPTYVFPSSTTFQNEWTVVSPQGWLDHGALNPQGLFICYYGIDNGAPAGRPAFYLQHVVPPSYRNCSMDPAGKTLVCETDAPPPPVTK